MKRPAQSFLLITLILVALPFGVWGAITATYVYESPIYFSKAPGAFTHPTTFGGKLGRMTVYHDEPLYNPTILTAGLPNGPTVTMKGPFTWWLPNDYNYDFQFSMNVVAVAYPNGLGGGGVRATALSNRQHLLPNSVNEQVTTNPFIVDFYLVNTNLADPTQPSSLGTGGDGIFKEDDSFTFVSPSPFNPSFYLAVTKTLATDVGNLPYGASQPQEKYGKLIEINGDDSSTIPMYDQDAATAEGGDDGFWFGDDPPTQPTTPTYEVFFEASQADFTISDAYTGKVRINTAKIKVLDGVAGQTYARDIIFTDSGTTNSFQLKPYPSGSPINYDLYFETESKIVNYGERIPWNGLVPFPLINERGLWIGGIKKNEVDQRLSGSYSDTIYVNIVSPL